MIAGRRKVRQADTVYRQTPFIYAKMAIYRRGGYTDGFIGTALFAGIIVGYLHAISHHLEKIERKIVK